MNPQTKGVCEIRPQKEQNTQSQQIMSPKRVREKCHPINGATTRECVTSPTEKKTPYVTIKLVQSRAINTDTK